VRFTVVGDTLRLDSVRPDEGWTWRPDLDDTDDDVAIDFHHESDALKVDFEADIHYGVLLVEVETSSPDHDATLDIHPRGGVRKEALVRRLLQAMNQHGAAAFAALISTDFVNPFSPPVPGNSGRHCAV
jgi:hypothetical protein